MHTNETLSKLSEHEINKLVNLIHAPKMVQSIASYTPKYCDDPSLIMPIAFENRIGIDESGEYWQAGGSNQGKPGPFERFDSINKNPLRAICEVYILMNQDK